MSQTVLSARALNRALLARQSLIERSDAGVLDTIGALVGMQAQAPLAPYVGLWSRVRNFVPADLSEPLESRDLVRATLMRGTVHLVARGDALELRPLVEPAIARGFRGAFSRRLEPDLVVRAVEIGREVLAEAPRTRAELRELFAAGWPEQDADAMAYAVSYLVPTVQPTPRGLWGREGRAELALMTSWLERPLASAPSIDEVVVRYLAAFGPASVNDAQTWSGLTRLRDVFDRLAPRMRVFASEAGERLYDLPDAPRPDAELPVPPRLLPEYDNVFFSHRDRSRILDTGHRVPLPPGRGARAGTVLLDGYFRGTWRVDGDTVRIVLHDSPTDGEAELLAEGERLARFLGLPFAEVVAS